MSLHVSIVGNDASTLGGISAQREPRPHVACSKKTLLGSVSKKIRSEILAQCLSIGGYDAGAEDLLGRKFFGKTLFLGSVEKVSNYQERSNGTNDSND